MFRHIDLVEIDRIPNFTRGEHGVDGSQNQPGNRFLEFNEHEILLDNGRVTHEIAKSFAESEFEKYRIIQDRLYESDFDRFLTLEQKVSNSGEMPE